LVLISARPLLRKGKSKGPKEKRKRVPQGDWKSVRERDRGISKKSSRKGSPQSPKYIGGELRHDTQNI